MYLFSKSPVPVTPKEEPNFPSATQNDRTATAAGKGGIVGRFIEECHKLNEETIEVCDRRPF